MRLKAMQEGVIESAQDFMHMICHPGETIGHMCQAAYFVTETLALYDPELIEIYPEKFELLKAQRSEQLSIMYAGACTAWRTSTGPDRAKVVTKFASDCIFQHKALQVVGAFAGVVRANAGTLRTMEYVADIMGHESEFAVAGEKVARLTQELEAVVQWQVSEGIASQSSSKYPVPVRSKILTLSEVTAKTKKYGGKIPVRDVGLMNNAKYYLNEVNNKIRVEINSDLLKECLTMKQLVEQSEVSMCIDLEHIANIRYELIKDSSGAFYTVDFKGGHFAGTMQKLEQEGIVKIQSFLEFGTGCIEYQVEDLFTGRLFRHTEFPSHWNVEKIVQEVKRLFYNRVNSGGDLFKGWTQVDPSCELFDLKLVVNIDKCKISNQVKGIKIITMYPVLEG